MHSNQEERLQSRSVTQQLVYKYQILIRRRIQKSKVKFIKILILKCCYSISELPILILFLSLAQFWIQKGDRGWTQLKDKEQGIIMNKESQCKNNREEKGISCQEIRAEHENNIRKIMSLLQDEESGRSGCNCLKTNWCFSSLLSLLKCTQKMDT